jgi:hypothetical protein
MLSCNNCQSPAQVKCSSCNAPFCGDKCASIDAKHKSCIKAAQYLRYIDTNYIFGTKDYFTLWRESGIVSDAQGDVLFRIDTQETERIFKLLDLSMFHKRTEKDHAQCCDIPYRVIEYGGDWVADMKNVPDLAEALLKVYQRNNRIFQTRMRAPSSMK